MANEQLTQVSAELVKAELRSLTKDAKLTFTTQQEIPAELLTKIIGNTGKTGWLSFLIGERQLEPEDVLNLPEIHRLKDEKSPSTKLRNILYLVWQKEEIKTTFEVWYASTMEKLCDHFKEKLN